MKKKEMGFGEIFQKGKTAARRPKQGTKGAKGAKSARAQQGGQRGQTGQVERIVEHMPERIPERISEPAPVVTPKQPLNINIPADLHRRFKAQCTLDGSDMTTVIVRMIEDYMGGER